MARDTMFLVIFWGEGGYRSPSSDRYGSPLLKSYQCLNCDCAKSMNAVKQLNSGEKVLIFVNVSDFE